MLMCILYLLLLLPSLFAIRTLKDGPVIDKDGREYKSSIVDSDPVEAREIQLEASPSVRVTCTPTSMVIHVKTDLYGPRHRMDPGEIYLGDLKYSHLRQCQATLAGNSELIIKAGLQHCGTELSMSDDSMIYSNRLTFSPSLHRHGIVRKTQNVVPVFCSYKRTDSSEPQAPPQISNPSTNNQPKASPFALRLMSDDWARSRVSNVFYLGDVVNVEVSYNNPKEKRQLFIDGCVATLSPDATSVPRYFLIENNGCFTDSRQRGSNARFLSRPRADVLQLQFDAFLFRHDERNTLFLTCQLKATSEMWTSTPVDKACTYVESRWENVDGMPDVCRCCDGTCEQHAPKHLNSDGKTACDLIVLGPLVMLSNK
ncbi:zona pellucida sperm-binding protein 3-like [Stigmatopora argus]